MHVPCCCLCSTVSKDTAALYSEIMMYVLLVFLTFWLLVEMVYCYRKISKSDEQAQDTAWVSHKCTDAQVRLKTANLNTVCPENKPFVNMSRYTSVLPFLWLTTQQSNVFILWVTNCARVSASHNSNLKTCQKVRFRRQSRGRESRTERKGKSQTGRQRQGSNWV